MEVSKYDLLGQIENELQFEIEGVSASLYLR